ncbi:hypothetical protein SAMN04488543_4286 [Friedmanniella luteola]|uniref:Uncharacterized protein n=1 Tax=Friedmanniella luteola TaxID=546871 RepID=A0A1H2A870_9ACTN|nr:hypothetical protein [Friedmanniella luteola]SDT42064.1 hypothetical protein SAMN04488543_4286 [Friedmanniella luteola]
MTGVRLGLLVPLGILFSQDVLRSHAFQFLAAFVAVNTIMYVTLAVAKMLPKVYPGDWRRGRHRRGETRSIHPDDGAGR